MKRSKEPVRLYFLQLTRSNLKTIPHCSGSDFHKLDGPQVGRWGCRPPELPDQYLPRHGYTQCMPEQKVSAGLTQSYLMRSVFGPWRSRGSGTRVLLFTLESALGGVSVVLMAALAHVSSWLLTVAALLYLLIVVPMALLCGFWQAVIVSLTAVVAQSWFSARQPELSLAADPAS